MWKLVFSLGLKQMLASLGLKQILASQGLKQILVCFTAFAFDPNTVVFMGSSSVEFWKTLDRDFAPAPVLNLGKGGTTYQYVLEHAREWAEKYPSRRYVIYSGDNDLAEGDKPALIANEAAEVARRLHKAAPEARLIFLTVKPSLARKQLIPLVEDLNARLKADLAKLYYARVVDIFPGMLDRERAPRADLFRPDGLHMTAPGYRQWTDAVKPALAD